MSIVLCGINGNLRETVIEVLKQAIKCYSNKMFANPLQYMFRDNVSVEFKNEVVKKAISAIDAVVNLGEEEQEVVDARCRNR